MRSYARRSVLLAISLAAMGGDMTGLLRDEPKSNTGNSNRKHTPKGLKEWNIYGVTVHAINYKNAVRKAKVLITKQKTR